MRRWFAAGGLFCVIAVVAALSPVSASAATLPTPTNVTATAQPGGALVSFTAASPPAGAVYTYTATASPGGMVSQADTNGAAPTELGFGNLTNGITYTFTVTVSDGSGDSSLPSAPSNAVTPELTVPAAPEVVSVQGGDHQATVSFGDENDNNDGGSDVTKYTVTASPGGEQVTGQGSPLTVTGLTDGTSYTLAVTATNAIGTSAPGTSSAVTPLATPSATTAPQITGDQHVGQTLQVSTGAWTGSPDSFEYQWYDCSPSDPTSCNAVGGGGSEYTVQSTDIGFTLEVQVIAENADGEFVILMTAPTAVVSAYTTPVATTPASVTGDPLVGDTVHAEPGVWTENANAFAYQWYDCDPVNGTNCVPIYKGTSADYTVAPDDGGSTLEVAVTATNPANLSATSTSSPTATVTERPGAPEVTTLPTIGSVDGGEPVSGTQGSWSNSPTSFTYTWLSCLPDFSTCYDDTDPSTTLTSYSPTTPDSGDVVLLEVVATNAVGDSVAALSEPSVPVAFPPPTISVVFPVNGGTYLQSQVAGVAPQITCTPALGTQLTECDYTLGTTSG
ncbi:MAG TPA: hypothetical protein VIJ83_07670, partial [Solirubrobacteraceae bacterium]